jgi:hypothetical protein
MHTLQRFFNSINTMLAAGFCERWPATHEREGFCGWPPCQRVAAQRKKLAAKKPKEIDKTGDKTKIVNKKGDAFYIDHAVFNIYEKNSTVQDALTSNFDNINNEPSITAFEILDEQNKELFKVEREDFETLSVKDEISREGERLRTEIATLNIVRLSFEKGLTCDFYYKGHKIKAKIEDPNFQKRIDDGESFSKGDVLESELVIKQTWDESVQTYVNKERWYI